MDLFRRLIPSNKDGSGDHSQRGRLPPNKCVMSNFNFGPTLGTGSFGRVFMAKRRDDPHAPPVAIKRLKKAAVIRQKQVDHILSEKRILQMINHPFTVNMLGTFKDDRYLYIVMEYVIGGEFFTLLRKTRRFENDAARFYAAQVTLIFEYLHDRNIIYRDLKPENLLVDAEGYLKLTDFGFAKVIEYRTYTLCGTPEYIAPEVLLNKGHGKPVDWWTLGILIYEMILGYPPFFDDEPMGVYQKILGGRIAFPKFFDKNAKVLVKRLLTPDLAQRYGNLKNGVADVKDHRWFAGFDWNACLKKSLPSPYRPPVKGMDDTSNFEAYPESTEQAPPVTGTMDPFTSW
ncbi:UNVERIFIED_CONTAM: AGC kinase [Hammondia hammondi]|eukprot:XP_008881979.1 AGC kinase [Hammondia hammondi]